MADAWLSGASGRVRGYGYGQTPGSEDHGGGLSEERLHWFYGALQTEGFPMCGMDEITVEFLIAVLAARFQKYDVASRMVATILTSPSANARTKDKARELKDQILED